MSLLSQDREPFRLLSMRGMSDKDESDLVSFSGSVGPNGENRREDVIRAQTLLARTGDFDPDGIFPVPTGWPSSDLYRGIKKFQKRAGLDADGTLLPVPRGGVDQYGIGETIEALRSTLGDSLAGQKAPPRQIDAHYETEARRQATGEDAPTPISAQNGIVLSDVADAAPPQAKPGEQVALGPLAPAPIAARALPLLIPPAMAAGEWMRQQYEKGRSDSVKAPPLPQTPPSEPLRQADEAATKTPPLVPPEVDANLQGRPAAEREPTVEQLIPPEVKEWYEGLEPFDQKLAEQLLLVFNRRGDETTRLGNARLTQALMKEFTNRPGLAGKIEHVRGSIKDGVDGYLPEEHMPHPDTGQTGGHWPDMTFKLAKELADELGFEYLRVNSGRTLKRIPGEG